MSVNDRMIRKSGLVLVFLTLLVPPGILLEHRSIDVHNHASLIADVHDHHKTSSIMLIESSNYNRPSATGQMHSWFLQFSRRGIFSVATTFSKLAYDTEKYYNRISRPLFVVFLDTNASMEEFALATTKLRISFPVWLVLFADQAGNSLKEFCQRPKGNPFNLIFSTEMLVLCYDDPILKEWYAQSDNRTRVSNLATWSPESGFIPFSEKSLYARRSDMFGETLRVITGLHSAYVSLDNGVLHGFMGKAMMELSAVLNFTMEIGEPFEYYGYWDEEKGAWIGAIGEVVARRVDLVIAEFSLSSDRAQVVDYTIPLVLTSNRMYFKQPSTSEIELSRYFKTFDSRTWAVVLGLIATAPIILTMIKMRGWISTKIIIESYTEVWGIYCQQGLPEFSEVSSVRLAFFSIFISALVVSAAYSAFLTSYLTLAIRTLPFNSLEGFANDGTYKLILLRTSDSFDFFMNTQDSFFRRFRPLVKRREELPYSLPDAYNQTCADRVGFYVPEAFISGYDRVIPCKMTYIETGNLESLAMILSKNNPYTGLMNYHLQRLQDYGILNRLRVTNSSYVVAQEEFEHDATISISDIASVFRILAGGMILGCLLVVIEKVVFWKLNKTEAAGMYARGTRNPMDFRNIKIAGRKHASSRNRDKLIMKCDSEMLRFGYRS